MCRRDAGLLDGTEDSLVITKVAELDAIGKVLLKPESAIVQFSYGGSLATVKRERRAAVQMGGGIRGVVSGFSRQSAKRLKNTLQRSVVINCRSL